MAEINGKVVSQLQRIRGPRFGPRGPSVVEHRVQINPQEIRPSGQHGQVSIPLIPSISHGFQYTYSLPPLDYDHRLIAAMGARFVSEVFGVDTCPRIVYNYNPTIEEFMSDAISAARTEHSVAIYAFALLSRLNTYVDEHAYGTFGLFITAYMIASKMLRDNSYTNTNWCSFGKWVFTLQELNRMERAMCANLKWNLSIDAAEFVGFQAMLYKNYRVQSQGHNGHPPSFYPISSCGYSERALVSVNFDATNYESTEPRGRS